MIITTLVILLVVVVVGSVGFCSDEKFSNEVIFDRTEPESMLSSISSRQRKHVRKELMHLLGLDHIPRPAGRHRDDAELSAPKYMLSLYRSLQGILDDEVDERSLRTSMASSRLTSRIVEEQLRTADTVTSFINQVNSNYKNRSSSSTVKCRFDLSQVSPSDVLTAAVLRIYKHPRPRKQIEKLTLEIHRSLDNDSINSRDQRLQQRLTILSNRNGWIDVNVTPLASKWMQGQMDNDGLEISVYNHKGALVDAASVGIVGDSSSSSDKQIFLVAFFKNNPEVLVERHLTTNIARHKRSAEENKRTGRKNKQQEANVMNDDHQVYRNYKHALKCQLRTLKVSFKDLKWQDWIIAPEGYGANYCDGDCVSPLHAHNATNHAIVQKMAHLIKPTTVPKPCCAPTKLAGLSVLYFDDNSNVILKKYRNMVVKACGCH